MDDRLTLTFAEIAFALSVLPEGERPGFLAPPVSADTAGAGLASLVARRLCAKQGDHLVPTERLAWTVAALGSADRTTRVTAWTAERTSLVYVYSGPAGVLAVQPGELGQYVVGPLEHQAGLGALSAEVVSASIPAGKAVTVLVQSRDALGEVSLGLSVDERGDWRMSDSAANADKPVPTTGAAALARVREVFAPRVAA